MDDFDHIDEKLEAEIVEAFAKATRAWPRGSVNCRVPRLLPVEPSPSPRPYNEMVENVWFEFRRELIENVSGFPLTHYWLLCNGEWRLIAVHGRL